MEKSLKAVRCKGKFHYLEMTVIAIFSSVNLEKTDKKILDYEKQGLSWSWDHGSVRQKWLFSFPKSLMAGSIWRHPLALLQGGFVGLK